MTKERTNRCSGQQSAGQMMSGKMIEPLKLEGNRDTAEMIDNVFANSGFNARRLADAARLFARMLDQDATVALTLAGAMTPIGMSGPIIELIKNGLVDFIITTGANIYHDLHRPFGFPVVQGHWLADDRKLADNGIARIYDTFIGDDETLTATDKAILRAIRDIPTDKPISTARLHYHLGKAVTQLADNSEKSFVAAAAEYHVPVYTSSPGDSSVAMNLVLPYIMGRRIILDPLLDVIQTTAIVRSALVNGVVEIGGGSPKNFYLQTQPMLRQILRDNVRGDGHDYVIQLTADSPHWGGLSGATPQEALSWGKIKDREFNTAVVYSCASITFPLICQYVLSRSKPREHKRLYTQIDQMVGQLIDAAKQNPTLMREWQGGYLQALDA